jgi:hypothetical protein
MRLRLLFALCAFSLLIQTSFAQNVTINPFQISVNASLDSADVVARSIMINAANSTKTFTWTRTIVNVTSGWDIAVCDKDLCYLPIVSTRNITLSAGEQARMDIHAYPNRIRGQALVRLTVTEVGNATNTFTATYGFNTPVATRDLRNTQNIRVYPNPASDYFTLSDESNTVEQITVYNILGRAVKTFKADDGLRYNISELPDGVYLVRMHSANGATVKTVKMNKIRAKA